MTKTINPAPVRCSVTVRAPQSKAFETFTSGFGRWWKRTGSGIGKSAFQTAIIEPFIGGRWYEIGEDRLKPTGAKSWRGCQTASAAGLANWSGLAISSRSGDGSRDPLHAGGA